MKHLFRLRKNAGFIQIPILLAIFLGLIVVGGGTYEGVKVYQEKQETRAKQKAAEVQQVSETQIPPETSTGTNDATGTPEMVMPSVMATTPSKSTTSDKPTISALPKLSSVVTTQKPEEETLTTTLTATTTIQPITPPEPIISPTTKQPVTTPTPTLEVAPEQTLTISDFGVVPGDSTANFNWSTNIPAVGKIIYSEQGGTNTVIWSPTSLSTHHYANATKLIPGTTYNYTIEVVIPSSTKSISKMGSFTTTGSLIQSVKVFKTPYDISIDWTTPVEANCSIVYYLGDTPVIAKYQKNDQAGKLHHSFSEGNLSPNTTYGYTITATPIGGGVSQTYSGTVKTNPLLEMVVSASPNQTASLTSTFPDGSPRMCVDCSATLLRALVNWKYDRPQIVGYTIDVQGYENISGVGLLPDQQNVAGGSSILTARVDRNFPPDTFSTELQFYFHFVGPPTGTGVILPTLTSLTIRDSNGIQTKIPTNISGTALYY